MDSMSDGMAMCCEISDPGFLFSLKVHHVL